MPRTYKKKLGTPRGVSGWKALESAGDVRRFLAWCIHSIRDQSLDPRTGAILAQIGAYMLKAVETDSFEKRLEALERAARAVAASEGKQPWEHNNGAPKI